MPEYSVSSLTIVNEIKSLLQDRYLSGFPILKELLQNADDAKAHNFMINALLGWSDARNPLLRVPGILVVNDGKFDEEDQKALGAFGESAKLSDRGTIGKFGIGQKAVFHFCDAFLVSSFGNNIPFSMVVNPFINVKVKGNITGDWEPNDNGLAQEDLELLRKTLLPKYKKRCLVLWLPLRSDRLQPKQPPEPPLNFSSITPSASKVIEDFSRIDDLRTLLTSLRYLRSIEIRKNNNICCGVHVVDGAHRLHGPQDQDGERTFGGSINTSSHQFSSKFVGRENNYSNSRLSELQNSRHWPTTFSVFHESPKRDKGEPHGAVTLSSRQKRVEKSQLLISWAVFLPISESHDIKIPLSNNLGKFNLLLHGCFFMDSGRRQIEGLTDPKTNNSPSEPIELRRKWNAELRDSVVLPLVPAVLHDALSKRMVNSKQLASLVVAIGKSPWFIENRCAICKNYSLVQKVEESGKTIWRLVSTQKKLRPLPNINANQRQRIKALFPDIHSWAKRTDVLLYVDKSAALTRKLMYWTPDDLECILSTLSPRAFHSSTLTELLSKFLDSIKSSVDINVTASFLVSALRKAMLDKSPLAPANSISSILTHIPPNFLFPLPASVQNRQVLRALASVDTSILPVRKEWMLNVDSQELLKISNVDLQELLNVLKQCVGSSYEQEATLTALTFLVNSKQSILELTEHPDFADHYVIQAQDLRKKKFVPLSLQALNEQKLKGLLFASSPKANTMLPLVVEALPDVSPLMVQSNSDAYRVIKNYSSISPQTDVSKGILELINTASRFGAADSRARLLQEINPNQKDDRATFRKLCAGHSSVGNLHIKIWYLDDQLASLERIVTELVTASNFGCLAPSRVAKELNQSLRQHLRIERIDHQILEKLLAQNPARINRSKPSSVERDEILKTGLPYHLLKCLPIHNRSDGSVGSLENVYLVKDDWPVDSSLKNRVLTLNISKDPDAGKVQKKVVSVWSAKSQIDTALSLSEPHLFYFAILEAIDEVSIKNIELQNSLLKKLKDVPWLISNNSQTTTQDVLNLPDTVFEEAGKLLFNDGKPPLFLPLQDLSIDIREHPSFKYIEKNLLPDREESYVILMMMIEEANILGQLAPIDDDLVRDLKVLADEYFDLKLPGWQLMASILRSMDDNNDQFCAVNSFTTLSEKNVNIALQHLNSLADIAKRNVPANASARRIYAKGFEIVSQWNDGVRREVFRKLYVPTVSREWRKGDNVMVGNKYGIAPSHVLAQDCANLLNQAEFQACLGHVSRNDVRVPVDLLNIDRDSANQQRKFLENFRGRVPSDLVIIYLGLIGRYCQMRKVAAEWVNDAATELDTLWDLLVRDVESLVKNDRNRYILKTIDCNYVSAISLSGEEFEAPINLQDGERKLVVGNSHKKSRDTSSGHTLFYLSVKKIDVRQIELEEVWRMFRNFIETVALDCLHLESQENHKLNNILDSAVRIDQTTLKETKLLLRDRLPTILEQLELPVEGKASKALREYERKESRINRLSGQTTKIDELKENLWSSISGPEVTKELLNAVREKIIDYGYSGNRVLFELFQNADDAYSQLEDCPDKAEFHVEVDSDSKAFRTIHWGRPINYLGSDSEEGYLLGRNRDLLNMLLMNFSTKKSETGLTGKFGLGFKSVYMVSDTVGIASGFISLRTLGGFVPTNWDYGIEQVQNHSNGAMATVIDVPFSSELESYCESMIQEFRASMFWMSAFARCIRRIRIECNGLVTVAFTDFRELFGSGIGVVTISGTKSYQALRLDLGDGYSMLIRINSVGPSKFSRELKCLWNFAPLEEKLTSVWILNGPFPVDPGRGRLAGSNEDREKIFRDLGQILGERLVELSDFTTSDWKKFSCALNLANSEESSASLFWSRLLEVFVPDFDDEFTRNLHIGCGEFEYQGYGYLAFSRRVVPTQLLEPLDSLVCANEVTHFINGALSDSSVLQKVLNWPSLITFKGKIVASQIASQLEKLGFRNIRAIRLFEILLEEMGTNNEIDVNLGKRLGSVITINRIENGTLRQEKKNLYRISKNSHFQAKDGSWRPVRDLSSELLGKDEKLICQFAPTSSILHSSYRDTALKFFEVARSQSGYGPNSVLLHRWAVDATDLDRQVAVLRYIITGNQGQTLAAAILADRPDWLPPSLSDCVNTLLSDWMDEDRNQLLVKLYPSDIPVPIPDPVQPESNPTKILEDIFDWWVENRENKKLEYQRSLYPCFFEPSKLRETHDRTTWFTMFALACFQTLGRTREQQHQSFITRSWQDGWWCELAESRPCDNAQQWINRLENWSATDNDYAGPQFLPWRRRTFVDLYTIARWLDEYVEIFKKLPRIIENCGKFVLSDLLQPSHSQYLREIDTARIDSLLGIGANWMIRELLRQGVYKSHDKDLLAPYCWSSTQRVRNFLFDELGYDAKFSGKIDESPYIYDYVSQHLDDANFKGDFDLPLQIYSLMSHSKKHRIL